MAPAIVSDRKPSQVPLGNLLYGSIVFAILGVLGCVVGNFLVSRKTRDRVSASENRSLTTVVVFMAAFCMWLQWICAYMHQMNPITPPQPEAAE